MFPLNTWIRIENGKPPFDTFVLVHTTMGLIFWAFRKSNKFFCATPVPAGVSSVVLDEYEIAEWFQPSDPETIQSNEKTNPQ